MIETPTVSVIIPTHNSAATIARAIDSVLVQSHLPDEIIVVDDASSDATCELVTAYASRGIRLLREASQLGAGGARNRGIEAASGELVAFLDADDEWLSSKIEKQMAMIKSDPQISFVACDVTFVAPDGRDLGDLFRCTRVVTGPDSWKALLACNFVATSTVVARRCHLLTLGGFDAGLKVAEDQNLFIKLAFIGSFEYVPEKLARQHEQDVSLSTWNLSDLLTYTLPMIDGHLAALRTRLSDTEIRMIRGERLSRFGRVAYAHGDIRNGAALLAQSMFLGYRPLQTLWQLAAGSPPALWFKRRFAVSAR